MKHIFLQLAYRPRSEADSQQNLSTMSGGKPSKSWSDPHNIYNPDDKPTRSAGGQREE